MAAVTDYTAKITSQHSNKPKFIAMLSAVLSGFVDGINLAASIPALYDLDAAQGDQLDAVGAWIGLSRRLSVPIANTYFALDTAGRGLNQGVWYQAGQPTEGVVNLDDATYKAMLRIAIATNHWDGSLGDANAKLLSYGAGVLIQDNMNMTGHIISYGTPPSALFTQLVAQGYIPLRPAGVQYV